MDPAIPAQRPASGAKESSHLSTGTHPKFARHSSPAHGFAAACLRRCRHPTFGDGTRGAGSDDGKAGPCGGNDSSRGAPGLRAPLAGQFGPRRRHRRDFRRHIDWDTLCAGQKAGSLRHGSRRGCRPGTRRAGRRSDLLCLPFWRVGCTAAPHESNPAPSAQSHQHSAVERPRSATRARIAIRLPFAPSVYRHWRPPRSNS